MTTRRCWTCNTEHDLDEACKASPAARARRAAGAKDDWTSNDLFGPDPRPTMTAQYRGECSAGDEIEEGDTIRPDGEGGWIHVNCEDEV